MQRALSLTLVVVLAAPGGSVWAQGPAGADNPAEGPITRAARAEVSRVALDVAQPAPCVLAPREARLRDAALGIKIGARAKVRTLAGQRVEGKLLAVASESVLLEAPDPSVPITYYPSGNAKSRPLTTVELRYDGMKSIGKPMSGGAKAAIGIGITLAVVAGVGALTWEGIDLGGFFHGRLPTPAGAR